VKNERYVLRVGIHHRPEVTRVRVFEDLDCHRDILFRHHPRSIPRFDPRRLGAAATVLRAMQKRPRNYREAERGLGT
jgi:hypothetical protein